MAGRFDGLAVWITGGGSGLGRAMALEFARQGADVAVSGRREDRLAQVVADVEELGRRGLAVPCDVTSEEDLERAVAAVVEAFGKLDVVVANAGMSVAGRVERLTAADWRRQLDVNVIGAALTAAKALPELKKTRGRVALVGSVAGLVYFPGFSAYQASKAAILAIGSTLSLELHCTGVSCTTIQPGFVTSELVQVRNDGTFDPSREDRRPKAFVWQAEPAARVMVRAIHRRRRVFTFTGHGRFGAWVGRHLPGLVHLVMTRMGGSKQAKRGKAEGIESVESPARLETAEAAPEEEGPEPVRHADEAEPVGIEFVHEAGIQKWGRDPDEGPSQESGESDEGG